MLHHIPLLELPILALMILVKALRLRRKGVRTFVIGSRNKNEWFLLAVLLFFLYVLLSGFWDLPFPSVLQKSFWEYGFLNWLAATICTGSLIWLGISLNVFGNSFRMGIDQESSGKLITTGTFAYSRNPVFVAFISFFTGYFLAYSNAMTLTLLVSLIIMTHRQILQEEIYLKRRFGDEYNEYYRKVNRYL